MSREYYLETTAGNESANAEIIYKFGRNVSVGTSLVPISIGGIYRTPQVGSATLVRVKAGDVDDDSDGTGAQAIFIEGLNALGERTSEVLITNGTSAGTNSVNSYIRLYRTYVYRSGTYATVGAGSHAAAIVIENAAGTEDWVTISGDSTLTGQSEVGLFTVPKGKQAYILSARVSADTTKITTAMFFKRDNILQTTAPFSALRKQFGSSTITREYVVEGNAPHGPFLEFTDIGFLASVTVASAEVSVEFSILLRDKE